MLDISYPTILLGGAIAGFTIFLGLPIARWRTSPGMKIFLNAGAVGILLFLFVEISYHVIEQIESVMKLILMGYRRGADFYRLVAIFVGGFGVALVGLYGFEARFIRRSESTPRRLATMIALGIGLHNFSEGLVIGQQFAGGALALGMLLVVGFALHNATEGFGIAAPLSNDRPSWGFLLGLGLLGGGPTFLGTLVGTRWTSELVEALFLSLAAGAILYIVGELIHLGRQGGGHRLTTLGLLVGFFLAFGSDLVIERAATVGLRDAAGERELRLSAGDYFFDPNEIHLQAGVPTKLIVDNQGEVEHEIEVLGLGEEMEQVVPWKGKGVLLIYPRHSGVYPFICDMPGHLMKGMRGRLIVH